MSEYNKSPLKRVNQSLGQNASIGIFTGFQFAVALFMFGMGFIVCTLFGAGIVWSLLAGVWLSSTVIVLSGKRPYLFWSRVFPGVPVFTRGYIRYSTPQSKKRAGNKKMPKLW
jgi:O-antigen/teichoic acid export membrane protein